MINSTENEDDDNQQNNDEKIVVLEEEKEETVVQQEEDVPHDNVEEEIVEDGLGPPLEGPEEEGVKEVEEEQPLTTTFQLDYLNEEDSEDDEFVVTIGDIKAKVISTSSFQSKQQQNKIINGTIDLDTNPTLKDGTPIYDLDLATMEDKPWRKPGADITDYFNYGFNEETWNQYCERQRKFRQEFGNNDQSAINKAILSNIQLTGSLTGSTQIGLTTFAGGRQLVNLSGGIGQQQQQEKQQMQQQKVQKIIVDLCKPQHNTNSVEDAMMSASVIPLIRTVISETGVVRQESTEIMPSSFKTEVSPKLENILLSSTNIDSNSMLEHSDAFVHSPISKTPPPIEQQQQPINVIDFSKPPPSFDPLIPPPLSLVNQLPQVVPSLGSQMVPQQHQLPVVVQQTITQTSSANLLSTIPPVASANSGTNLDLPPGVEEGDGPPGISSSIPPVSSMPPPQRILDFSQPPPTSQFSYNPTPSSFSMGGPPSTFAPPGSHYPMHQQSSYAPRHHFQPSYRHPFGGFGGRGGFHDRFRSSNRGISRPIDDHRDRDRDNNNRGDRDRSDSGSDSGPSHRKKRRSSRTRSRSRSPSTGRRRKDDDRSSKHRSSDHHKDSKDRKRKKEKDRSKERHSRSSRRSPSIKKESRIKSERRSSERDKDDRDSRSRHRSSPRRKEKESSVKSELRIKPEQRSPERD